MAVEKFQSMSPEQYKKFEDMLLRNDINIVQLAIEKLKMDEKNHFMEALGLNNVKYILGI